MASARTTFTERVSSAGAERARERHRSQQLLDHRRVVTGLREQVRAPAVAGEHQRAVAGNALQQMPQIFVSGLGVPHVELDGLADVDDFAHGE